jgi:hypothetical protein
MTYYTNIFSTIMFQGLQICSLTLYFLKCDILIKKIIVCM